MRSLLPVVSVQPDYNLAHAYVQALAGDPATAVLDWRCLSDWDNGDKGHARRGTLPEYWPWLCEMNAAGFGVFVCVAAMDGNGRHLANVDYLRAVYVDLDKADAMQQYDRAAQHEPAPAFAVSSSVGRAHVYWTIAGFRGNDRFQAAQRRVKQLYNGDGAVIDACRVMRLPGTINGKYSDPRSSKHNGSAPHLVTCHTLRGFGQYHTIEAFEASVAHVNVIEGGNGTRRDLGTPELAAPSLQWCQEALDRIDPNTLARGDWLSLTAAWKQAAWTLGTSDQLYAMWSAWCSRYSADDPAEDRKQWLSLTATELGWPSVVKRAGLGPTLMFGPSGTPMPPTVGAAHLAPPVPMVGGVPATGFTSEFLTSDDQRKHFDGVSFIVNQALMLCPDGRQLGPTAFNAKYGGYRFMIDNQSKVTDEAWKAATRSTMYRVPLVDHIRFLPHLPCGKIVRDELGRDGVNVYKAPEIIRKVGSVEPFLSHVARLLPDANDQKILLDYLAHNVKYPGYKIPWAPLIQSAEGAGKGVFKKVMRHCVGRPYFYTPKASELAASGAKFNAWLRNKIFILVDEIKTDEKRELLEVLKPLISEEDTEIQGKGVDQDLEDNFSNWMFFSNWKDAIPVDKNGRRYAIMYTPFQTAADLIDAGMDEAYFDTLYAWLDDLEGASFVANYLMEYPILRGAIPKRAPLTSSTAEAIALSVSPVERALREAIEDQLPGFRGGWVSSLAAAKRIREASVTRTPVGPQLIGQIVERMGYVPCGRSARGYMQETLGAIPEKTHLWHYGSRVAVDGYGEAQGYFA